MNTLDLLEDAKNFHSELINWRRHLHENPEPSLEEYQTSKFVQDRLNEMGFANIVQMARTGVVAMVEGQEKGETVALRADMDALRMADEKTTEYKSKNLGITHACGHDGHTSMLLGAAKLLKKHPPRKGSIKLIFQPAEEGQFGAKKMIDEGVLKNPTVKAIAALHVNPDVPTGYFTCSANEACAASDSFEIEIIGQGGHAGHPDKAKDAITIAAEVITSLQQLISREIDPVSPTVMTVANIQGGTVNNAIAGIVRMAGTVRTLDSEIRETIDDKMERIIKGITEAFDAKFSFHYTRLYPPLLNARSLVTSVEKTVKETLGEERFQISKPSTGAEDFAFYTNEVPGVYFRLGVRNELKDAVYPLHHPKFDLDEEALPYGSAILAQWALNQLENN
ncbi:M20 metallopeptidase family protein [Pueribacillus theae]|uniref:M20 metallopeptidase family protein n=1 Tax=Pueribacillus theae TaxID=2171751 RepID=UPI00387E91ED